MWKNTAATVSQSVSQWFLSLCSRATLAALQYLKFIEDIAILHTTDSTQDRNLRRIVEQRRRGLWYILARILDHQLVQQLQSAVMALLHRIPNVHHVLK
jgi:hypothetical protein